MPRLSQWMIRAALLYLLLGFTFGALLLTHKGLPFFRIFWLWGWLPAHIEFLLFGWIVQVTMGVAFWILPRYWEKPHRPKTTYAQLAFMLLNLGIWLVVAGTALRMGRMVAVVGRGVEIAAVISFIWHFWPRIRGAI